MDDSIININSIKLEEAFSVKKKEAPKVVKSDNKDEKPKKVSKLSGSRQQNINIVLGKIKIKPGVLIEALIAYDENILTPSNCELIQYQY